MADSCIKKCQIKLGCQYNSFLNFGDTSQKKRKLCWWWLFVVSLKLSISWNVH